MILCMPTVGNKVRVTRDWTFRLYMESRNESLFAALGIPIPQYWHERYDDGGENGKAFWNGQYKHVEVTLPAGLVLTIDRIYIRKGAEGFDSITFIANGMSVPGKKGVHARVRFWAKLFDVNQGGLELLEMQP